MIANDVWITGVGLVTSLGRNARENLDGMRARRTGLRRVPRDGLVPALCIVGEGPDVDPFGGLPASLTPHARFLNRASMLGFAAAAEAVQSSGIEMASLPSVRKSAYTSSHDLSKVAFRDFHEAMRYATSNEWREVDEVALNKATPGMVNPFYLLESLYNNIFSFLTAAYGIQGASTCLAAQCPSGAAALALGFHGVREGRADAALVVASCHWTAPVPAFELHGLGDGGAAMLLESAQHARSRDAKPLGRLLGCATAQQRCGHEGFGLPLEAFVSASARALTLAGLSQEELGMVVPHASARPDADRAEMEVVRRLLAGRASGTPVACLKPYTGHMAPGSDVADLILGLMALREGWAPATLNFEAADPGFESLALSSDPQPAGRRSLLALARGVCGSVAATVASAE
jgi:3-oxoacyl-[acyl-carrier-protein] synthase II